MFVSLVPAIFVGCSTSVTSDERVHLIPVDTIFLSGNPEAIQPYRSRIWDDGTNLLLFIPDRRLKTIHVFDLRQRFPAAEVPLNELTDAAGPKHQGILLIAPVAPDRLMARFSKGSDFFLMDTRGRLIKRWLVEFESPLRNHKLLDVQPFQVLGPDLVYCQIVFDHIEYIENPLVQRLHFAGPLGVIIKLNADSSVVDRIIGEYPAVHRQGRFYDDKQPAYTMGPGGDLVFSFGITDSLVIISPGGEPRKYYAGSKQFTKIKPFNPDSVGMAYWRRYTCEKSSYGQIVWDQYRQVYYRVLLKPIASVNDDGTANTAMDKPWSIIILDDSFRILGEVDMPSRTYDWRFIQVIPEGLMIANNHPQNPIYSSERLSFTIFGLRNDD